MFRVTDANGVERYNSRINQRKMPVAVVNDFRLTLISDTPFMGESEGQTLSSTVYLAPIGTGNRITLYEGNVRQWQIRSTAQISVAVPSTLFRLFDLYAYWTGSAVALETVNWNQSTGTITNVTAASPAVVTSTAHGLSNGDLVGISGIVGTVGTNATQGLNGTVWVVANKTANTFEAQGSDTSGLAYTSDGTWYLSATRATALTTQDGTYVKTGDATRRYLGTSMTRGTSGQTEQNFGGVDELTKWLLWNYYNRFEVQLRYSDSTDSYTYTTATFRPTNGRGKFARIEVVIGVTEDQVEAETMAVASHSGGLFTYQGIGVSGTGNILTNSAQIFQGGNNLNVRAIYRKLQAAGFHYLTWLEKSDATGTATWYGDAGAPTDLQSGFRVKIRC